MDRQDVAPGGGGLAGGDFRLYCHSVWLLRFWRTGRTNGKREAPAATPGLLIFKRRWRMHQRRPWGGGRGFFLGPRAAGDPRPGRPWTTRRFLPRPTRECWG